MDYYGGVFMLLWEMFMFNLPLVCWEYMKWNTIENKSNDTDNSEGCLLDKENDPIKIFEFVTIALFAAVISCST